MAYFSKLNQQIWIAFGLKNPRNFQDWQASSTEVTVTENLLLLLDFDHIVIRSIGSNNLII